MDTVWAVTIAVLIGVVIIGSIFNLASVAQTTSVRLELYSRVNTIAHMLAAREYFPLGSKEDNNQVYRIEYTFSGDPNDEKSPFVKSHGDRIFLQFPDDDEALPYNVVWWEVWAGKKIYSDSDNPKYVGVLIMTPYVWYRDGSNR